VVSPHNAKDQPGIDAAAKPASFVSRARGARASTPNVDPPRALGERALRTRELLIETAKSLFLERGYGGTTIDNIAEVAGVSRASFYTYFSSKRETLLAAGVKAFETSLRAIQAMSHIPDVWTLEQIKDWVGGYMKYMDAHGAFLLVWSQAAWQDAELRAAGVRGSMRSAAIMGMEMQRLGAAHDTDPRIGGQALLAMLDRFWYVWRVTHAPFKEQDVIDGLSRSLASMLVSEARATHY
jgi:AcrR family transcriptional regulator